MAEIRQKIISCPQGHYYDANRYASCPYCGSGSFSPTVDPFAGGAASCGATAELDGAAAPGGYGNFNSTIAPNPGSGASERMGKTQFVDSSTPAGAPAPVVGWLVAVEGPCRGTDYRIHTGYNYIGREAGDICIRGDSTISAEKDANVTYVPQTRQFYIAHELGKNVLLVNNMPVIGGSTQLHNYDRITIGTTQLVFVSLCGEQFSWNSEERGNA
ncbi:MAG: hypothetical protein ACI3W8_07905 [Oscillospiraceae bacterium]